jgi:hypothetical protein
MKLKENNMKKFIQTIKGFFVKPDVSGSFSFGERGEDGFAPVMKDGVKTNCRIYLWDAEDVKILRAIGDEIHRQNCR